MKQGTTRCYEPDVIQLFDWMWSSDGLSLSVGSIELMVFARIYSFSHHQAGLFYEPASRTAEVLNVSRRSIYAAIKSLTSQNLIAQRGVYRHGDNQDCPKYAVSQDAVDRALAKMGAFALPLEAEKIEPMQIGPNVLDRKPKLIGTADVASAAHAHLAWEADDGFKALLALDANGNHASIEQTHASWAAARRSGYSSNDILDAYQSYLAAYAQQHPDDGARYVMKLEKFLTNGKGLRYYAPGCKDVLGRRVRMRASIEHPDEAPCPRCGAAGKHTTGDWYVCPACAGAFKHSPEASQMSV